MQFAGVFSSRGKKGWRATSISGYKLLKAAPSSKKKGLKVYESTKLAVFLAIAGHAITMRLPPSGDHSLHCYLYRSVFLNICPKTTVTRSLSVEEILVQTNT